MIQVKQLLAPELSISCSFLEGHRGHLDILDVYSRGEARQWIDPEKSIQCCNLCDLLEIKITS